MSKQKDNKQAEIKPELYTLLGNVDGQEKLGLLGFKDLGSGWFRNENDTVRIRLWKDSEVDFWLWRGNDDNQIHFRGMIHSIEDVKWVLRRCFNLAKPELVAVVDEQIEQLSKIQVELLGTEISADDYNEISDKIGTLKEYLVNCRSYNGN